MKTMILFIKGLIIGIGKIIPGVSGSVLSIILGVYYDGIDAIVNIFSDFKRNIIFLFKVGLGILCGIVLFSIVISYMLDNYYVITMLFFVGLIIGGIPSILREVDKKDYKYVFIVLFLFTLISLFNVNNSYVLKNNFIDYIIFFVGGIVETCGTVIPGLSSTALLLILGIYDSVIESIGNISSFNINFSILIPFGFGIVVSLIFVSKFISCVLKKYKKKTYSVILGLVLSSIIVLIVKTFCNPVIVIELFIGLIFMIFGIIISSFLG